MNNRLGRIATLTVEIMMMISATLCLAQVSVLTQGYDNARDGLNANETTLTPSTVNAGNFGKLLSLPTDGYVYAQPLYLPNVVIPGNGTHNLLFAATEHGTLYAYDADGLQTQPIWQDSLVALGCPSGFTCTSVPASANNQTTDLLPEVGITATPVIDPSTSTIYAVAKSKEVKGGTTNYVYRLHAIDIPTGTEHAGSPVAISGSASGVTFSPLFSLQRPGLALANNSVVAAFGSWGDDSTWYGWAFAYDKTSLAQLAVLNTAPSGSEGRGGVWMHGQAPVVDPNGFLYFTTGNGAFNGISNYGDSILKVAPGNLAVSDYFTPFNQQTLDNLDLDIASGGLTLLPDSAGTTQHPHILVGCGKNGVVYVLDRDNLGHFNSVGDTQIIQELPNLVGAIHWDGTSYVENCYSTAAYWQGNVYYGGIGDPIKEFAFTNGKLASSPSSQSTNTFAFPGATPAVSANGATNGIVWAIENAGTQGPDLAGTAILHAYDAANLANELYNSAQVNSDAAGPYVKFSVPTVANGKVYVGTQNAIAVYGDVGSIPQAPAPTFTPAGGTYASAQAVTISDALSPSATIYYTTDGTTPTTTSPVYTTPINIATSTVLRAIATAPGYRSSLVTSATYVIGGQNYFYVQGNYTAPQTSLTSVTLDYTLPQVAGDLNVVIVGWNDSTTTIAPGGVTDSAGNTYVLAAGPTVQNGTASQAIYYAKNIAASNGTNSVTITFTGAARIPDVRILEYGGIDQNSPLDGGAGAQGNTSTSTVSLTTNNSAELVVGGNLIQTLTTGPGSGFTSRIITNPDGDIAEDRLVASPGATTASASLSASGAWIMQAAAFKTAPLSTGGPSVISVSPNSGTTSGGTGVMITGTNFVSGATVSFGGTAATNVVVVSATSITATTPAHAAGAVTVTVTNPDTQTGSLNNGFTYTSTTAPTVTSVTPGNGPVTGGTSVTIAGTNFVSGATVSFGGTAATNVIVGSSTSITVTTPAHAGGAVTVTVTNPDTQTGSLINGFTYNGAPTITSITPNNGTTAGGTSVTIAGTSFVTGATVSFGGTAATNVVVGSSTSITVTTPAHAAGAVTVTVTNPDTQTGSLTNGYTYTTTVSIGFAQVAAATPQSATQTVTVAYPGAQTLGNMNVVVVGWNDATATVQSVTDSAGNTYSVAIPVTSGTGIRQTIYYAPNIKGGSNTVTVTFNQAAQFPDVRILEYRGVSAVDVAVGASGSNTSANSGSAATTSANDLIFGANTVATGNKSAGTGFTARIITSPDSDLAEDKVVTTAGSNSATATLTASGPWVMQMVALEPNVSTAPTISSVTPNSGTTAGGTSVTIAGTNFVAGATVTFGGTAATNVVVTNSTSITATTPAHAAGAVTVTVTNPDTQTVSLSNGFTYNPAPTVTAVSPAAGPATGGTGVTITGTGFLTGATVSFGGTAATNVVVVSATSLTVTTPAHAAGAVTATVTNPDTQTGSLTNGFTYNPGPTITSVNPSSGPATGGTAVTITGTNFVNGAMVSFGGTAATKVVVASATSITATTPSHVAGAVTVTVTNPDTQTASLTNGFTYNPGPTITSVNPSSGPATGGTAVTITGTNFVSGATVSFGGTAATNVVVVSATSIAATTPAHAAGAVTVTVTNPDTQTGSLTNGFTYTSPSAPTVTSVTPGSGPATGGTGVTIAGTNFVSGATVSFGGTAATNVVVGSATSITATTPAHAAGAVTVTVTNPDTQTGSLTNGFTFNGAPTVSSVTPNNGTTAGGTSVTIAGTNFVTGATVSFGGTAATNVVVGSSTSITATTPAHAAGAVIVTVTNPDTQAGSLTNGYTYTTTVSIGFAQVAAATPQSATQTVTVTYPGAQTLGNMNVVVVGWNDTTATVQSVTDSAGNTYSVAIPVTSGTGLRQTIYYAPNIKGGSNTVTVTFNQAAQFPDIRILEYRGISAVDVAVGASGNNTSASSGSATTTSANDLIFGAATVFTGVKAAGSGFTSRIITKPDTDNAEDRTVTATGSYSATATLTSSGQWVMQMVAFK